MSDSQDQLSSPPRPKLALLGGEDGPDQVRPAQSKVIKTKKKLGWLDMSRLADSDSSLARPGDQHPATSQGWPLISRVAVTSCQTVLLVLLVLLCISQ